MKSKLILIIAPADDLHVQIVAKLLTDRQIRFEWIDLYDPGLFHSEMIATSNASITIQ